MLKKTGKEREIEKIESNLKKIRKTNPYFYIALADNSFDSGDYEKTLHYLKIAKKLNKHIPQINTLKMKVYLAMEEQKKHGSEIESQRSMRKEMD